MSDAHSDDRRLAAAAHVHREVMSGNVDFDVASCFFDFGLSWIECVKELRAMRGCSIQEADRELLLHDRWRRFAVIHANQDIKCRLRVWQHIKHYGDKALLGYANDRTFDRLEKQGG